MVKLNSVLDIIINIYNEKDMLNCDYKESYEDAFIRCNGCNVLINKEDIKNEEIVFNKEYIKILVCETCKYYINNNIVKLIEGTYRRFFMKCLECAIEKKVLLENENYRLDIENYKLYDNIVENTYFIEPELKRIYFYDLCDKCVNDENIQKYKDTESDNEYED